MTVSPFPITLPPSGPFAGIATITLEPNQGPMVVLDHPLIQRLEATIKALAVCFNGHPPRGLVLASGSPRVFVAGADLKSIQAPGPGSAGLDDDQLDKYLAYGQRVFGMICDLPYPTAAAINGAALGGGLELAMHCDALIGAPDSNAKPYPIGLPEAGLSICPGWGGTNLLPARIDPADAIKRTASGQTMMVADAIAAHLFDRVSPDAASLLDTARQWVHDQQGKIGAGGAGGGAGRGGRDGKPLRWIGRTDIKSRVTKAFAETRSHLPATDSAKAVAAAVHAGLEGTSGGNGGSGGGWQAALDVERRELTRLRSTPAGKAAIQAFFDRSKK